MKKYTDIILTALKGREFESILEMGCGQGDNLRAINEKYPEVKMWGCDIDETRTESASKVPNTTIKLKDITDTDEPFKRKFDIVFLAATLMYIPEEKIGQVIKNIKKSAKKEVILIEINVFDEPKEHVEWEYDDKADVKDRRYKYKGYSMRDYEVLLRKNGFKNIKLKKIPRALWPGINYKDDGYIISAEV